MGKNVKGGTFALRSFPPPPRSLPRVLLMSDAIGQSSPDPTRMHAREVNLIV